MSTFTETELRYLGGDRQLGRIATVSRDGMPHVDPVGWPAAERYLIVSPPRWTIVRATAFLDLWAETMTKPIVFGRGENRVKFVSLNDVAAAVERAVLDTDLRGQRPRNLTFDELAALLQQARGTSAKVRHIPRAGPAG